jgi:pimeloyl-ACP methyl ester carboxylesterase
MTTVTSDTVRVSGASLYYEATGSGPVLLMIPGGPTDAGMFGDLPARLAAGFTCVAYDPRGHSRSVLDAQAQDVPVSLHADDAAALIRALTNERAYVYGNSGGGTIGLELVARHPELVTTLVAHEAPVMQLLPDADAWRARFDDVYGTLRTQGVFPAISKFGALVEEGGPKYSEEMQQGPAPDPEMMQRMTANFEFFLAHEIREIGAYVPDAAALRGAATRIVCAAGEASQEQAAKRATVALAEALAVPVTWLPGAHGGWGSDPEEFAARLDEALRS